MTEKNRMIGLVLAAAIALLFTLGWGLKPFDTAGNLSCEGPWRGAEPREKITRGFVVGKEEAVCARGGGTRVLASVLGGVILLSIGVAAVLLPESKMERVLFGDEDPEELYYR